MKISVIIPAYNEAGNIAATIHEVEGLLGQRADASASYEIIVIDDGSTDSTFETVQGLRNDAVRCLRLSRRSGSHIALRAGLDAASGDCAVCIAADGQDDPHTIDEMLETWRNGMEIVWALRKSRGNEPLVQKIFARIFYKLLAWFGGTSAAIDLSRADFYLLDRKVINAVKSCNERNTSLFGLIVWLGFRQGFVEYERRPRRVGESKWNFRSRMRLAKDWIIAFSGLPLKLMTAVGSCIAVVGFIYALYVIISSIAFGSPLVGWSSVMTAILVLGGGQMMMLGIIGEYLWRTLDESRDRPAYFIENDTRESTTTPVLLRRKTDLTETHG